MGPSGLENTDSTLVARSVHGRAGVQLPEPDIPRQPSLPSKLLRQTLDIPELSELDVVRHFSHLAELNFSVDTNFYPLGSCSMKYNPKVNDLIASLP